MADGSSDSSDSDHSEDEEIPDLLPATDSEDEIPDLSEGFTSEEESDIPDLETDTESEEQNFQTLKDVGSKQHTPSDPRQHPSESTWIKTTSDWADLPLLLEGSDDEDSDKEDIPDLMSDSSNDNNSDHKPPDMDTDYDTDVEWTEQPRKQS